MQRKSSGLKQKAQEWHKQEILKAARVVFTRKGFHRATMDDVAGELGGSKGALYLYFTGKDELFMALVDQAISGRYDLVQKIFISERGVEEKIRAYVAHTFSYFENNRDLLSMFMMLERDVLCSDLHKEIHEKVTGMMIKVIGMLEAIMKEGIKKGVLKKGDPVKMAVALGGMVQMFIMHALFHNRKTSLSQEVGFIMSTFLEGVKQRRMK